MDDDELELFLENLEDEDWVIMVGPDGNLKSVMIPQSVDENTLMPESIFQALYALDPNIVKTMEELQKEEYKGASNDNKFLRVIKPGKDDSVH
tara:strand:- start:201 stop:479 length:279 start_codon:yes stop_codon:yes gene_type:complete